MSPHPITLCIQYLIENYEYTPHSEWPQFLKMLLKETNRGTSNANIAKSQNSAPNTPQTTPESSVKPNIPAPPRQYMQYKWILICRHMEAFLHEELDLDIESLLQQEGSDNTRHSAHHSSHHTYLIDWKTDFDLLLQRIQQLEQRPTQRRKSMFHGGHVVVPTNGATQQTTQPHSEGASHSSQQQDEDEEQTSPASAPPPLPSRRNRKPKQIVTREIRAASIKLGTPPPQLSPRSAPTPTTSRSSIIESDLNNYKELSKELDLILQHQLKEGSGAAPISKSTSSSKSTTPKSSKPYLAEWNIISQNAQAFTNTYIPSTLLFYAHDRDALLKLRKMKFKRDPVLQLLREYFIQDSIVDELVELFSIDDGAQFDTELKQLQTIVTLPRAPGKSFASLYEKHENFLYKYGQVLIREPKMFLRVCHVLHKKSALYWIVEDESTFAYLSQVLTVDEALSLLMNFGHDETLMKLSVAILNRYPVQYMRLFLLQVVNSLTYCPDVVLSTENAVVEFLIRKASENFDIAQLLNWHLSVSADHTDPTIRGMFRSIHYHLLIALKQSSSDFLSLIVAQQKLVKYLTQISTEFKMKKLSRKKKVALLQTYLSMEQEEKSKTAPQFDWKSIFGDSQSFCLPLSASKLTGIDSEHASIFKSAMQPFRLVFHTPPDAEPVSLIWKFGDDLRQDECVINFIELIDTVLFKSQHELDLRLTPYRCLATSPESGFVQLVPNVTTVYTALQECGSIMAYFEKHNSPQEMQQVLENYTRSLAGNCIISFLLGLGDRHLENILLTNDGRLFHIDFGFIMGFDPKPFAPKIRITDDMLNVFNGVDSPGFDAFIQYCSHAYQILRQHASLLINMMRMMTNLPHINETSIQKTLVRNLRLDLNNKDAFMVYRKTFTKSLIALAPKITERIHNIAQSFRD